VDWTPDDDAELEALDRTLREFVASCQGYTGRLIGFLDADSRARDLDQIRRALGEEKISYFGWGNATLLGTAYADLFPDHLGSVSAARSGRTSTERLGAGARTTRQAVHRFAGQALARCAPPTSAGISSGVRSRWLVATALPVTAGAAMNEEHLLSNTCAAA
jgi:pimeloyl-ACP methyl ester carboxylesterase